MKLICCYIENFGTLSKFSFEFSQGLNTIIEENGWGKSTFAVYIKAMFYGMEYKRTKELYERKKYMPWNGGKYGGNLVFEVNGKSYKIERTFGKTNKEDTFVLYDLSKNTKSEAFHENIGEEIWGIDRSSFEKSVFISLQNYGQTNLLTDIISSKLSDVDDSGDDMDKYEKAYKVLDDKATEIRAKRGNGGKISKLEENLQQKKEELKQSENSIIEIENHNKQILELETDLKEINAKLNSISADIRIADKLEKKKEYQRLQGEVSEAKKDLENIEKFFNGLTPTEAELAKHEKLAMDARMYTKYIDEHQVTLEERKELEGLDSFFSVGIPADTDLDSCKDAISKLSIAENKYKTCLLPEEDELKLTQLHKKYQINIQQEYIDILLKNYEHVKEIEREISSSEKEIELLNQYKEVKTQTENRNSYLPMTITGAVVFVLGLFLCIMAILPGIVVSCIGFLCLTISMFTAKKGRIQNQTPDNSFKDRDLYLQDRVIELNNQKGQLEKTYKEFIEKVTPQSLDEDIPNVLNNIKFEKNTYDQLMIKKNNCDAQIAKINEEISEIKQGIYSFLGQFISIGEDLNYLQELRSIENHKNRYLNLSKILEEYDNNLKKRSMIMETLTPLLELYFQNIDIKPYEAISKLKEKRTELSQLDEFYHKKVTLKDAFEKENDITEFESLVIPSHNLFELQSQQEDYIKKATDINSRIANIQKDIDRLSIYADKKEDIESEIERISEEISHLNSQHSILLKTMSCLSTAKEELSIRYMSDMEIAFRKYLKEVCATEADELKIDINLNVQMEEEGSLYSSDYFSSGKQDLVNVCIRMALLEAIFKDNEKPIVIMDDPFVNFDEEKLKHALKLIEKVSGEYQVIYFVCHTSRS